MTRRSAPKRCTLAIKGEKEAKESKVLGAQRNFHYPERVKQPKHATEEKTPTMMNDN
jgi:hypothetical protein